MAMDEKKTWFAFSFQNGATQLHSTRDLQTMSLLFFAKLKPARLRVVPGPAGFSTDGRLPPFLRNR